MGLQGDAAIVGMAELRPLRHYEQPRKFTLEQWADLARIALDDAGISPTEVNGICTPGIRESASFVPSTVAEFLGTPVNFGEFVDLDDSVPQLLAIVELDEGPRLTTELVNVAPDAIKVGMRVKPHFDDAPSGDVTLLRYEPA